MSLEPTIGTESKKPAPIVIAGMGPGGLTAAIEAARKGLPVVIVENRDHFSRVQRLHFDPPTFKFLESLRDKNNPDNKDDKKFFEEQLFRGKNVNGEYFTNGTVQVKDVQAFLARKLAEFPNVDIRRGKGNNIVAIDPKNQTVTLEKPGGVKDTVKFSHMVAADGAKRGVTELLNKSPDFKISHQPLALQPRQAQVGTVSLQAKKDASGKTIVLPPPPVNDSAQGKFTAAHLKQLNALGWDKPYFPRCYVFHNEKNNKFFVSGEIPKTIENMKDEKGLPDKVAQGKALEQWGKFIVSVKMGYKPDEVALMPKENPLKDKRRDEKNNLLTTAFRLELQAADKPSVQLGQGGAFAMVGDTYKNANFYFSHGMNNAIADGKKAIECIDGPNAKFDFTAFDAHLKKELAKLISDMGIEETIGHEDMSKTVKSLDANINAMIAMAEKMNDPQVKQALKEIKNQPSPMSPEFDGMRYLLEIENLQSKMEGFIQGKMKARHEKKVGVFHSSGEMGKLQQLSTDLKQVNEAVNKDMSKYFRSNIDDRETFKQSLEAKAVSPAPVRAR